MAKLTQDYLKECMTYNPETGVFMWNERPQNHFKGDHVFKAFNSRYNNKEAGSISCISGYREVGIDNKLHKAHRLAFLYMEGYLPENQVDHMDRNRANNKWNNLREVSHQCNMQNCNLAKSNTSGVCGVSWNEEKGKWKSYISFSERQSNLGYFDNFDDAVMRRYHEELTNPLWSCSVESTAYVYLRDNNLLDIFTLKDFPKYKPRSNNTSGVTGISWSKSKNRWRAYIKTTKRVKHVGYFKNFNDAVMARYQEEIKNLSWVLPEESTAYNYLKEFNLI